MENEFTREYITKKESRNLAEYQEKYPKYYAVALLDKEKPGYGWIIGHGPRPMFITGLELPEGVDPDECVELRAKVVDINDIKPGGILNKNNIINEYARVYKPEKK
jgi:hypothetical protein